MTGCPWLIRCMAEAPGDAAGCSAWYQGRMRARVTTPLRERLAELLGESDEEDYAGLEVNI